MLAAKRRKSIKDIQDKLAILKTRQVELERIAERSKEVMGGNANLDAASCSSRFTKLELQFLDVQSDRTDWQKKYTDLATKLESIQDGELKEVISAAKADVKPFPDFIPVVALEEEVMCGSDSSVIDCALFASRLVWNKLYTAANPKRAIALIFNLLSLIDDAQLAVNPDIASKSLSSTAEKVANAQHELDTILVLDSVDFGTDNEWEPLNNKCFKLNNLEYTYEVCMFGSAAQINRDSVSVSLGFIFLNSGSFLGGVVAKFPVTRISCFLKMARLAGMVLLGRFKYPLVVGLKPYWKTLMSLANASIPFI